MASEESAGPGLVIFLHGLGDTGLSFRRLAESFKESMPDLEWLTPTASKRAVTLANGARMTAWFDMSELPVLPTTPFDEAGFSKSTALVHGWIDDASKRGIPAKRIFLCGFSQGAALAIHAGIRYSSAALGGIVAFAGWMPGPPAVAAAQREAHTRVLLVHGTLDTKVPSALSETAHDMLTAAGLRVRRVSFHGYHELGHSAVRLMRTFLRKATGVPEDDGVSVEELDDID